MNEEPKVYFQTHPHICFDITDPENPRLLMVSRSSTEAIEYCERFQTMNPTSRTAYAQIRNLFSTETVHNVEKVWV